MVALDAGLGEGLDAPVDPLEELLEEPSPGLAVGGGVEGGAVLASGLAPAIHPREHLAAGLVLLEDLGKPGTEDDDLGVDALAYVGGHRGEPLGGNDVVEERGQLGHGGVDGLLPSAAKNLGLTAAAAALKLRRKTRQEWGKFFHTLPNPQLWVFMPFFDEDGP